MISKGTIYGLILMTFSAMMQTRINRGGFGRL
jgi:hypothetical protein